MSIRVYRLLRNNKEEGPFTAEELVQKKLKAFDLIWVDGRSAAWNYPAELPEFKAHVLSPEEQSVNSKSQTTISASVQAAVAMNDNIIQPVKKEKPKYRVSAAWSKIQTITTPSFVEKDTVELKLSSKKPMVNRQLNNDSSKSLNWQEAWLDWEKEKSTETSVQPVIKTKPGNLSKTVKDKKVILETKFEQPLDDLKDKYIDNIIQQKKLDKKNKASEFIVPALALLIIFSVGYWLLHKSNVINLPTSATVKTQPSTTVNNTVNNNVTADAGSYKPAGNAASSASSATSNSTLNPEQAEERNISRTTKKPVDASSIKSLNKEKTSAVSADIPTITINKIAKQLPVTSTDNVSKNSTLNNNGVDANGNKTANHNTDNTNNSAIVSNTKKDAVVKPVASKKTSTDYVNVPEYIQMNNGSANINVENVSDDDLDLVVVDVQYYDAMNRFRKGETLYLHNLKAGRNITIKTSKDVNSSYATSKVALISSDAKQVYVVGDN